MCSLPALMKPIKMRRRGSTSKCENQSGAGHLSRARSSRVHSSVNLFIDGSAEGPALAVGFQVPERRRTMGQLQYAQTSLLPPTKRRPIRAPFRSSIASCCFLLRSRIGRGRAGGRVGLELLARFLGALLQLFLQLLLGFLEHLRIGRRAIIGFGEFGER